MNLPFHPVLLVLVLLTIWVGSGPLLADTTADPVKTQRELEQVKKRIQGLQKNIQSTQTQRSSEEKALQKNEQAISAIQRKLRDVQEQQDKGRAEVAQLEDQQASLAKAKERQRAAMRADVITAWRSGRQEYLKLLLNQQDPLQVSRQIKYYDYFRAARLERMTAFNQLLAEMADNETRLQQQLEHLKTLATELASEQEQLQAAKAERKTLLARLDASLKQDSAQVNRLKANQGALEKVLKALQDALSDLPTNLGKQPFAGLRGKLKWPSKGQMLHRFGTAREQGTLRWNGVLIGVPPNSAVRAVHHGRVVFSDWMRGFGNLIIIDHGGGYMSLYGHNESLLKGPGDWVRGGDTIATSGSSGGQNQPGLYFEIRHKGEPVDPARWCRD